MSNISEDSFPAGPGWSCSKAVGFITKKSVTMHGHMNVKIAYLLSYIRVFLILVTIPARQINVTVIHFCIDLTKVVPV